MRTADSTNMTPLAERSIFARIRRMNRILK